MPTTPLPIVQSSPHGGLQTPAEFADRLRLDATALANECDLEADTLYDFAHPSLGAAAVGTLALVRYPIARAIVDVNRTPDDLENTDGAIKQETSYGTPVHDPPLTMDEKRLLIETHWTRFHDDLGRALAAAAGDCRLFLDCHNMAQVGPPTYPGAGRSRPLICLANLGDQHGEPKGESPLSCSPALLRAAGDIAADLFADLDLLEPDGAPPPVVALNKPFAGGYILRRYSRAGGASRLPGIMIEVNRGLFVGNQRSDRERLRVDAERVAAIRSRLCAWATALVPLLEEADR